MKNPIKEKDKKKSTDQVFRGGSWRNRAPYVRVSVRRRYDPSSRYDFLGFRIVRTKKNEDSSNR